jgi:uncharacterized membrane protein YjfL (UPF0719 family)
VFFTFFICILLILYRYFHALLYYSSRKQLLKNISPSGNGANAIHFFSSIIGIGILFSGLNFYMSGGIFFSLLDFSFKSSIIVVLYFISIYIIESVVLYNFDYNDEIIKRKNYSYAIVTLANNLSIAYILKHGFQVSGSSLIILIFLWLFSMVLLSFASKTFSTISKLPFNRLLVQKNMAIGISYMGFICGWSTIIVSSFQHKLDDIQWFSIQVVLKILLSAIIFPIFKKGLILVFNIKDDLNPNADAIDEVGVGYGVYEGIVNFTSCFLTTVITGQINFGTFYPVF